EYYIALSQEYLKENNVKRAQTAMRTVLQIDKTNAIANQLLQSTYSLSAPVELDIWTGYSKTGEIGSFNLRTVQLSGQVAPKWRMFAKYDNSLTLDLASLVRTNQAAQAFALGAITPVSHQWTSRLEYGVRLLPSNITQHIFSTEQVWFLPGRYSLKGGGFFGAGRQVNREWLSYVSIRIPVTSGFSLEPYYFYSKVQDAPKAENRWMLNGQLKNPRGFEINLGALYGKAGVSYEVVDNDIFGAYITGLAPFSKFVWGMASVRYEKAPFNTRLTAMTLGIKIRV
ncbi:MAG: hypothetical protein IT269_03885, partial [Saprospiraceae bacterium]|nr:hypothetical protein [Saprospiraceae bacterium]